MADTFRVLDYTLLAAGQAVKQDVNIGPSWGERRADTIRDESAIIMLAIFAVI